VELDFALDPNETRVTAKLKVRPNLKATTRGRPLVLNGEALVLKSLALNGKRLSPEDYAVTETALTIPSVPAEPFTLAIVTTCDPEANTTLSALCVAEFIAPSGERRVSASPVIDRLTCSPPYLA
jgi:aminopeptidase N